MRAGYPKKRSHIEPGAFWSPYRDDGANGRKLEGAGTTRRAADKDCEVAQLASGRREPWKMPHFALVIVLPKNPSFRLAANS